MRYGKDLGRWWFTPEEERNAITCPHELHIPCKYCSKKRFGRCPGRGNISGDVLERFKEDRKKLRVTLLLIKEEGGNIEDVKVHSVVDYIKGVVK